MNLDQYKPKIIQFLLGLFIAIPIFLNALITVKADEASDIANTVISGLGVNSTSNNVSGGTSAITNGVSYTRTGYLCYLLTKEGEVVPYPAYAFQSPSYNGIPNSDWVCTSRRGHTVSSWSDVAPWNLTPWAEGGSPSHEPQIKQWFTAENGGVSNAAKFVDDCWGEDAALSFKSDEYILVIETIMNFQYSVSNGSNANVSVVGTLSDAEKARIRRMCESEANKKADAYRNIRTEYNGKTMTIMEMMCEKNHTSSDALIASWKNEAIRRVLEVLMEQQASGWESGGGREYTSPPLIGTVPNLIKYKNGSTVFDSYLNKVAPHAEKIQKSEAGFTVYSGGIGKISDSEVGQYGVAMLIIHCKDEGSIHTYWQPHGSPGNPEPAPPNKIGKYNIVKGYYEENLTTGEKISLGLYETEGCIPSISIDGEPEFELVDWRTSTTHTLGVDPTNWNPPSSHIQQGTTPKVIQLKAPEKTVYVLLRRVTEEEQEEQEYNYIIKQSQISKRIKISKSDNLPLDEKIGIYDFRWFIPAHQVECITHTYNDECHSEKNEDQATILIVQNILLKNQVKGQSAHSKRTSQK